TTHVRHLLLSQLDFKMLAPFGVGNKVEAGKSQKEVKVAGGELDVDTYPIRTVGRPTTMLPPWAVKSPKRAAGCPPTRTLNDPKAITSGGPTHVAMSPTRA